MNPAGRPRLDAEIRHLIRRMARDNPTWARRRIQAELTLLGYEVAEVTVAKYMHRTSPRPAPTWRAFLAAQGRDIVAIDFFIVPTLTYRLLCAFVVLGHDRRKLLHINVTDHPTAAWTARQFVETFPDDTAPKYVLRDRDGIYGEPFDQKPLFVAATTSSAGPPTRPLDLRPSLEVSECRDSSAHQVSNRDR